MTQASSRSPNVPRSGHGYLPFAWLLYLPMVFAAPALDHAGTRVWFPTLAAVLAVVPLYVVGYWTRNDAHRAALIAAFAAIGGLLIPINPSASAFVVYAAIFASVLRPVRRAVHVIALLTVAYSVEAWCVGTHGSVWMWSVVFIVGLAGAHGLVAVVQLTAAQLQFAQEELEYLARRGERERIARDMHDVLGHTLSLIAIKAALARRLLPPDTGDARREIDDIHHISKAALADVRAAIAGYRASGLGGELDAARTMLCAAGIRLETRLGVVHVDADEDAALALAVREAITNVVRHAHATLCVVSFADKAVDGLGRELSITDDGRGMHGAEGLGLRGLRERIASVGGLTAVHTNPGTRITIALPPRGSRPRRGGQESPGLLQ